MSIKRFCIYFANNRIVEQTIAKQRYIVINNAKISFRRLINQTPRVIIFSVQPIVPHNIITNAITNLSTQIFSPITFMKAGFANHEHTHIVSFRRHMYMHPDDIEKIPDSILMNFDHTEYCIFLSDDTVICYLSKQTGHTSNHCKKKKIENKSKTVFCNNLNPISVINDTDNKLNNT